MTNVECRITNETRNSKFEIRSKFETRNSKIGAELHVSKFHFRFRWNFGIRRSNFACHSLMSMHALFNIWAIAKRELRSYFTSPVAYVFIVIFLLLTGFFTFMEGNF